MSGFYIGADGKARKVKGGYIGVDGKARKIKKGYIGDENGVARLCWSGFDPVFANNTWEEIAAACQTRQIPDTWNVGDQKTMTMGGIDYAIDIIGKNHDDYADGSGKAPITFQLHDCINSNHLMNDSYTNHGGWDECRMRKTTLPNYFAMLQPEVQQSIREVQKRASEGNQYASIITSTDKLFLLSESEVFGTVSVSKPGEGGRYEYYIGNTTKKKSNINNAVTWWLRSPYKDSGHEFCVVDTDGKPGHSLAHIAASVTFAFCF